MANRREFLKNLGIGMGAVGAGAFLATMPQLPAVNASSAPVERFNDRPEFKGFVPGPELLDRNMIYEFKRHFEMGVYNVITANPREEYRPYLIDLYANNVRLDHPQPRILEQLMDRSLKLATTQDTRGWNVQRWNKELISKHHLHEAKEFEARLKGGPVDV